MTKQAHIIDAHTGGVVATVKYETPAQRTRARNAAEKRNLAYGAHRYYCKPIFETVTNS